MKRVVFIAICVVGLLGLTSCGSTAPCGLSQTKTKQTQQNYQQEVVVANATAE
ncbi:hypothetical protein [uncultured Tenacibaculum sp.]|uniref:hypothetical protein n=1 Tax=uncultured Tenacibaculum sp. TaxID=174713 RepID=UPI002612AC19|nr:hypothetical protein [uncultured Tenacibaculum sp.]